MREWGRDGDGRGGDGGEEMGREMWGGGDGGGEIGEGEMGGGRGDKRKRISTSH